MMRSMALKTTIELVDKGSKEMETETDWHTFSASSPANIKTLEGFYFNDPSNLQLVKVLIKSHSGVGFGIYETLHLDKSLKGKKNSDFKTLAITSYTKAVRYGWKYLEENDIEPQFLYDNILETNKIKEKLDSELDDDDVEAIYFMGQAWAGAINLQRTNIKLVAQLPIAKALIDWSCERNPDIQNGACDLFYGMYEYSRPRMLGGNPKKGKKILAEGMKKYPYNMLLKTIYFEFVIVKGDEESKYKSFKKNLRTDFKKFKALNNIAKLKSDNPFLNKPELNLYNAIALKRYEAIVRNENEFF
jgi:hypothetical protein